MEDFGFFDMSLLLLRNGVLLTGLRRKMMNSGLMKLWKDVRRKKKR